MTTDQTRNSQLPRRFYKQAAAAACGDKWQVELDGRVLKTPAKQTLLLPAEALANAIAAEWDAQAEHVDPATMPLTRLTNVAIDQTPAAREALAAEVAKYAETDLVCHLAEGPAALRERQEAAWRPLRDWAGQSLGIVLIPVEGIIASPQPSASLEAAHAHAMALGNIRLTGLAWACGLYGSGVLALAVERGRISAGDAFHASRIDEDWQIEQWGADEEAAQAAENRRKDALALGELFESVGETD